MQEQEISSLLLEKFSFTNAPPESDFSSGFIQLDLSGREFEIPALAYGLLKHLGCKRERTWEKTAWVYSFGVRGVPCLVSSEKFGMKLYVPSSCEDGIADTARGMLIVGLQKFSNRLRERIDDEFSHTVEFGFVNQTSFLRRGYILFRTKAEEAYASGLHYGKRVSGEDSNVTSINFDQEPWWHSFGATVSFFSYLEHLYSGLLAFTGNSYSVQEVKHFMSLSWRKKHERLFKEAGIFDANQFRRLCLIVDNQRNLFSHGLGGKPGTTIYHLIPDVGFVPSAINQAPVQPNFLYSKDHQELFESNCKEFDDLETVLSLGNLAYGMRWAKSGLNFRFDAEFSGELAHAIDDGKFEDFIAEQSYLTDQAANFEY